MTSLDSPCERGEGGRNGGKKEGKEGRREGGGRKKGSEERVLKS